MKNKRTVAGILDQGLYYTRRRWVLMDDRSCSRTRNPFAPPQAPAASNARTLLDDR